MPLTGGDKLGPYEILGLIGAGGMGEVYRARDTRLDRIVAVKVSKEQFSERFEREARAVAALNHPNICTLHDVGPNYLVMEFVEGEAPRGPLALGEALKISRQVADALEAAHEKGIIHRDLKPANILLKPDGSLKVLDFGLAKYTQSASESASSSDGLQNSPTLTLTMGATQAGMILGTAAYLSPEQAKGKNVDKRADIWAFGVVLYELTTGRTPFTGDDIGDVLAAVIKEQPSYEDVPVELHRLLAKCLEKDPRKRLRDIGDVWELLDQPAPAGLAGALPAPVRTSKLWQAATAVFAIAAALLGGLYFRQPSAPALSAVRFHIPLPRKGAFTNNLALSPDGRYIAFRDTSGLWLHPLDSLESRLLPGTDGSQAAPFWSYDSSTLVFSVQNKLKKISANGSRPSTLADIPSAVNGGFWTADNRVIFGTTRTGLLMIPSGGGGMPTPVTQLEPGGSSHSMPAPLPDGKHFLYLRQNSNPDLAGIFIGSLDDKPGQQSEQRLLPDVSSVYYAAPSAASRTGHVVFSRENMLTAQPFDASRLQLSGDAVPIAEGVGSFGGFYLASNGALAYTANGDSNRKLAWFDRRGQRLGDVWKPGPYGALELSPDGTRVAADRDDGRASDVWVYEFARNAETQITASPARDSRPVWLDAQRVVYFSARDGKTRLFTRAASGAGPEDVLAEFEPAIRSPLPQTVYGGNLIFEPGRLKTGRDLMILPLENGKAGKPSEYLNSEGTEYQAQFSPDGRYVAYSLTQSGNNELQVSTFPDPRKERWTISSGGGYQPRWRRDGKELLYLAPGGKLMSVEVSLSPEFKASAPKLLFEPPIVGGGVGNQIRWDLTRDGQRFLINTSSGDESATPITVVLNWQALLKQ